jgi:hypothetical protein
MNMPRKTTTAFPADLPGPMETLDLIDTDALKDMMPARRWQLMEFVKHYQKMFELAEYLIETTCVHIVKEKAQDKYGSFGFAFCQGCGVHLGWYCPVSPERYCEYDDNEDPCHDDCLHCHQPDERK